MALLLDANLFDVSLLDASWRFFCSLALLADPASGRCFCSPLLQDASWSLPLVRPLAASASACHSLLLLLPLLPLAAPASAMLWRFCYTPRRLLGFSLLPLLAASTCRFCLLPLSSLLLLTALLLLVSVATGLLFSPFASAQRLCFYSLLPIAALCFCSPLLLYLARRSCSPRW